MYRQGLAQVEVTPDQLDLLAGPATSPLRGRIQVPGDKSISHRSLMLGALADGQTTVHGLLKAEDVLATANALSQLGVKISLDDPEVTTVQGVGLHGLAAPTDSLDLGNSGTGMRLMAGILAGQRFESVLTGDESLSNRPMQRIIRPLTQMGAKITALGDSGRPPLKIEPVSGLKAICYDSPIASAQVKSCVLLAGQYAQGVTRVNEPKASRDHTERMLNAAGCQVNYGDGFAELAGSQDLSAAEFTVPADISSAAFFMVAASLIPNSDLIIEGVGVNPLRTGIIDILKAMGADIDLQDQRQSGGEPVADIQVKSSRLKGIEIPPAWVPRAIDEFPILFVAAALADGDTVISGAEELRAKESDRIGVMCHNLKGLGIELTERPDGAIIRGGSIHSGETDGAGDHRCAMAMAIAAAASGQELLIRDCRNVATSFPEFTEVCRTLGMPVSRSQ